MTNELELCRAFFEAHPDDAARVLDRLPVSQGVALLQAVPADACATAFGLMTPTVAAECLERLPPDAAAALVVELRVDRAASLLRHVDDAVKTAVLDRLPKAEASVLLAMLRYPERTAGGLMDPRVVAVADDATVGVALTVLRRSPRHFHQYLYVVDGSGALVGVVSLRELLLARPAEPLPSIMSRPVSCLSARMGPAAILAHPGWRHVHTLPVVDDGSVLVGAIRYETYRTLDDHSQRQRRPDAVTTVFALGELYWLGLSGVVDGLASVVKRASRRTNQAQEGNHGSA